MFNSQIKVPVLGVAVKVLVEPEQKSPPAIDIVGIALTVKIKSLDVPVQFIPKELSVAITLYVKAPAVSKAGVYTLQSCQKRICR